MEENRCIICGMGIPEGRTICPLCEAEYSPEEIEKILKKLEHYVDAAKAVEALKAAFNELLCQWEKTFSDFWEQLQGWIYTLKAKIPKTPYFFKKKTLIMDKRPHKQHRTRNDCRKERKLYGNQTNR